MAPLRRAILRPGRLRRVAQRDAIDPGGAAAARRGRGAGFAGLGEQRVAPVVEGFGQPDGVGGAEDAELGLRGR